MEMDALDLMPIQCLLASQPIDSMSHLDTSATEHAYVNRRQHTVATSALLSGSVCPDRSALPGNHAASSVPCRPR
jgi:hypothetical protein